MSRYELNIYEEPIYVYELDRIFANPDELASFLNSRIEHQRSYDALIIDIQIFRGIHLEYVEE